jgi:hypothetical protein
MDDTQLLLLLLLPLLLLLALVAAAVVAAGCLYIQQAGRTEEGQRHARACQIKRHHKEIRKPKLQRAQSVSFVWRLLNQLARRGRRRRR